MTNQNQATRPLEEVDVKLLQELHTRFGVEINGFVQMIQTLFYEKNIDMINLMLRLVTASLQKFAAEQQGTSMDWWGQHIKGNA